MPSTTNALVATAKGLIVYKCNELEVPALHAIHFKGFSVNMIYVDELNHRWWASISHKHWGEKLHYSDNEGKDWSETKVPTYSGYHLPDGTIAKLRQIWCMHGGGASNPERLWLGTDPGGLFKSEDGGTTFELVFSLWNHPSRTSGQWFGAGSDYPFIHSIAVNPLDNNHIYVAVSCAGVFESKDAGKNWEPRNKGLVAAYLPKQDVEVGHDPHMVLMNKNAPQILWQQNHCGIFYSNDAGEFWNDVSNNIDSSSYGFSIAIDEEDKGSAWVIPVESDEQRVAPELSLKVYQTEDFGKSWLSVSDGLPKESTFDIVLRQAFCRKSNLMIFGTTNGNLYFSNQRKVRWRPITSNLTKVNSVVIG